MQRRKLLIAAVGVATINYAACDNRQYETSGNLVAPDVDSAQGRHGGRARHRQARLGNGRYRDDGYGDERFEDRRPR